MRTRKTDNKKRGFTLIEMAIVLVIIGLIIGAVLKGQDIITNARIKRFVNFGRLAEISQWGYFDRNGQFAVSLPQLRNMTDWEATDSHLNIGPADFQMYVVQYTDGNGKQHPGLLMFHQTGTAPVELGTTDSDVEILEYWKSFDTAIDGRANGAEGRVRGLTATDLTVTRATFGNATTSTSGDFADGAWADGADANPSTALMYWYDSIPSDI